MLNSTFFFQLQNEKRRLERDLEEIKRQKEEQDDENERLRQEVASLRYVFNQRHCYCSHKLNYYGNSCSTVLACFAKFTSFMMTSY